MRLDSKVLASADITPVREEWEGTETESLFFHLAKALADLKLLTVFSSEGKAINRMYF